MRKELSEYTQNDLLDLELAYRGDPVVTDLLWAARGAISDLEDIPEIKQDIADGYARLDAMKEYADRIVSAASTLEDAASEIDDNFTAAKNALDACSTAYEERAGEAVGPPL